MSTGVKLSGFVAVLVTVAVLAFLVGKGVGPLGDAADGGHDGHEATESSEHGAVGGLSSSEHDLVLELDEPILAAETTEVSFRIVGKDGEPVTEYDEVHEKELHFIAVRRDTTGFQHVHPERAADGTWTTDLDLTPGDWRLFADFQPAGHGHGMTLGVDAAVAGSYTPQPIPADTRTAEVDGYTVTLDGDLVAGQSGELTLTVEKDGEEVTDLEQYLGAYGHLVALRVGDLGYLHVHPEDGDAGPQIAFAATAPSVGVYRLFLDFQHDGVVRTAEFTLTATEEPVAEPEAEPEDGGGEHDHHH
ncbi:MAG: hypothetical protein QM621_00125 [Aeromicrobium sp.]|uniref:hypothetical protein n=1 Tax=Aeromicrobium sp. TaxID=1871063 RepID=UPI0039E491E5